MNSNLQDWIRLVLAPGVGAVTASRLYGCFGGPAAALAASSSELERAGCRADVIRGLRRETDPTLLQQTLDWAARDGQGILSLDDPRYPARLAEIADPPPLLFYRGDPDLLELPALAMVGSRNPTPGGAETAYEFARHFSAVGLCVASGLALGIDAASHRGALANDGLTLAVMGTGADRIYPARHKALAHAIIDQGGLILSELFPGTEAQAAHFPRRNRILSGLSIGTLVVEASLRSGSLITARLAGEQGREVFAIPGSIHSPLARGCHALIRQGAKLVETANDVLEDLAPHLRIQAPSRAGAAAVGPTRGGVENPDHQSLLDCLGHDPLSMDQLVKRAGLKVSEVASMLLILELQGQVSALPGGRYQRNV